MKQKIEEKIQYLEQSGPDTSTLSGMFFATDEGDSTQSKLTRQEIIDNALLLILAGSEYIEERQRRFRLGG